MNLVWEGCRAKGSTLLGLKSFKLTMEFLKNNQNAIYNLIQEKNQKKNTFGKNKAESSKHTNWYIHNSVIY